MRRCFLLCFLFWCCTVKAQSILHIEEMQSDTSIGKARIPSWRYSKCVQAIDETALHDSADFMESNRYFIRNDSLQLEEQVSYDVQFSIDEEYDDYLWVYIPMRDTATGSVFHFDSTSCTARVLWSEAAVFSIDYADGPVHGTIRILSRSDSTITFEEHLWFVNTDYNGHHQYIIRYDGIRTAAMYRKENH